MRCEMLKIKDGVAISGKLNSDADKNESRLAGTNSSGRKKVEFGSILTFADTAL